ncbi:restriction endonuclease subunit S (plasmid) [Candidatus Liberibacter asiaticus]
MTERPLSDGWQRVKFGDIAKHISKRVKPSETDLEVYIGLEHLNTNSLKIKRHGVPSDVEGQKLLVKKGQIIFCKRRAYLRKVAVSDWDCMCSHHAMVLKANPEYVISDFLPFFMQSDVFMNRAISVSSGSLSPTIKWKVLAEQEFLIPCLKKQIELTRLFKAAAKVDLISSDVLAGAELLYSTLSNTVFSECESANCDKNNALKAPKKGLTQQLFSSFSQEAEWKELGEVGYYSDTLINSSELDCTTFVGVDNLLQNAKGKIDSSYVPTVNKLTSYKRGDILLGNMRPCLKKIWFADNNGGCSGNVLAIRIKNQFRHAIVSKFLYYCLASDGFFAYNVRHGKGSVIPVGSRQDILKFLIPVPSLETQREIVDTLESAFACVVSAKKRSQVNSLLKMRIISDRLKND